MPNVPVVLSLFRCPDAEHKLLSFYSIFSGCLLWIRPVISTGDTRVNKVVEVVSSWTIWFSERKERLGNCTTNGLQTQEELRRQRELMMP